MAKAVVVGLDGFNPDLVLQWRDHLPNLSRMMEEGLWGRVNSTVPPITPQAWTAAQSSRNPGVFGFWDFTCRNDYAYGEPILINSTTVTSRVDTLYKILPRFGKRVAVINVPVTFPPPKIPNGFVISSFMTPSSDSQFFHPKELKPELARLIGEYILDASEADLNYRIMDKDRVLKRIYDMDEQRFTLLKHFMTTKDCDYVFCVIMGTDRMPHLFYRHFDPEHVRYEANSRYQNSLRDHYIYCDDKIGEVRSLLDDGTALLVHSDHSVQRLDGRICLNDWLVREGYMVLKRNPSKPVSFRKMADQIDWDRTTAWATGYTGQIYLNVKGREARGKVESSRYRETLMELAAKFLDIPTESGKRMETRSFIREDIHQGSRSQFGPDLFVYFDNCRYNIDEQIGHDGIYSYDTSLGPDDGGHGPEGFFALVGPGVHRGGQCDGVDLLDIAPTVMTLMGLKPLRKMEGRSLVDPRKT